MPLELYFHSFSSFPNIISLYMPFAPLLENEGPTAYKLSKYVIIYVKFYEC